MLNHRRIVFQWVDTPANFFQYIILHFISF